jgi:molybdopterin converting factor small subunit
MQVDVSFFGPLTDITKSGVITVRDVASTSELIEKLVADFPGLKHKNYLIAVNNRIESGDVPLGDRFTVSLLPPFSGG